MTAVSGTTLNAEANLTFDGDTLTAHMSSATPAIIVGDSNRTGAGQHLAEFRGYWDGNHVARIVYAAGDDTTNKDDGVITMHTTPSGGGITERLRITSTGMLEMKSDMSASDQANRNIFRFTDTDTSTTSNQSMGRLQWFSSDASGGGACVKAEIEAVANDTTPEANLIFKTHTSSGTTPTERMRIIGDGQVLINTTNSSSRTLNLKGTFGILSSSQTGVLDMSVTDGGEASIAPYVAGGSTLIIKTNASGAGVSERARFTSDGEFVMGTTSSSGARMIIQQNSSDTNFLDQNTSADSSGVRIQNYSFGVGRYTALSLEACSASQVQSASIIAQSVTNGQAPDIIIVQRTSVGGNTERLRISSSGDVGIGKDSPAGKLHISSGTSGDCVLIIEADTDNNNESDNPYIEFRQDGGVAISAIGHGLLSGQQNGLVLANGVSSGYISFATGTVDGHVNAIEKLRIDTSGTLTNTTTSSHSQGAGTFNIKGVINQYSQGSGSGLIFDCDFGRITGYGDDTNVTDGTNLSACLSHSTTDWSSSSSNTPMTVNGGTFQYRTGFGGYFDAISNGGRVSVGAGSGVPAMSDKLNTASMTIEAWCWYDGTDREVIVSRYGSGFPNNFNMIADPNGQFHYNSSGAGAGGGNVSGEHFPDKTWHHHVWQYDAVVGTMHRWYINGSFANSRDSGSSVAVSSNTGFGIFSRADRYEDWRGKIAIVRMYNRALSATEIKNHFELERGRFGV